MTAIVVTSDPAMTVAQDTPAITMVSPVSVIPQSPLQGISLSSPLISGVDFNTVISPGFYYTVDVNSTNSPVNAQLWYLQVSTYGASSGYVFQIATEISSLAPISYTRMQVNGAWGSWVQNLFLNVSGGLPAVSGALLTSLTPASLNYLSGFNMSVSSNAITIAAGSGNDSTNVASIQTVASIIKNSNAWVQGSNVGGLDSGSLTTAAWVHVFAIYNPSILTTDMLISASAVSPVMPPGYTLFRRIGSQLWNGAGAFTNVHQFGDEFLWDAPAQDANAVASANSSSLVTLTVPTGLQVNAIGNFRANYISSPISFYVSSPDVAAPTSGAVISSAVVNINAQAEASYFNTRTNTSGQFRVTGNGTGSTYSIATAGWIDRRGKI